MVCALPWKTCNCPWFNYNHIDESDRLNDMRVPYLPREEVVEVIEMPLEHSAPPVRRSSLRTRPRGEDRDLQRADEALAAHLQAQLRVSQSPIAPEPRRRDPEVQVYGLGNAGVHHMNESYTLQPSATAAPRTTARVAASSPRFFSRRLVPAQETAPAQGPLRIPPGAVRTPLRPLAPVRPTAPVRPAAPTVSSSTMAGLSLSGRKVGANRVGTWLNHVQLDAEAIATAPRYVDVDDWRIEGSMVGID
jgi:ariadne-1